MSSENLTSAPDALAGTTQAADAPLESQSLMCPPGCDCTCHGPVVTTQPTNSNGMGISQPGSRKYCPSCQGKPPNSTGANHNIKNDLLTTDIPRNPPDNLWLCCYLDSTMNNHSCCGDCLCCAHDDCCTCGGSDGCCHGADCCDCGDCSCCAELCQCCGEVCSACALLCVCCSDS